MKIPWYRCRGGFLLLLFGIGVACATLSAFLHIRTIQDLYITTGMAINGPQIWGDIVTRRIVAGDPIGSVTNRHVACHSAKRGHFTVLCYHSSSWDVTLTSKDGALLSASASHYGQCIVYFDGMTHTDRTEFYDEQRKIVMERNRELAARQMD